MKTDSERQTAYHARRKQAGAIRFNLWLPPATLARLDTMRGKTSRADWIRDAIDQAAAERNITITANPDAAQIDLEEMIRTTPKP